MEKKKIFYHLGIRLAIIISLLIAIVSFFNFFLSSNPITIGEYAIISIVIYCILLFIEMIYLFQKNDIKKAFVNLGLIVTLSLIPITILYLVSQITNL